MNKQQELWRMFPELVVMVRSDYKNATSATGGHAWTHALAVAQYGQMIAEDERIGGLAWVAGLCHNTDRLFGCDDAATEAKVRRYLDSANLSRPDKELVVEAVKSHSKLNDPSDSQVAVALKDADRLDNLGPLVIVRAAQTYPQLPAVDPVNWLDAQGATHQNPMSVVRDLCFNMEWEGWLRLPKAKAIAAPYLAFLRQWLELVQKQLEEVGLFHLPEELR